MTPFINNTTSKVAVVLINFNSLGDTQECIASLEKSTIRPFIILVDNCSINSQLIAEQLPHYQWGLHIILNKENIGFGRANNEGIQWVIENTEAEYIFLLNNDTIVQPDTIGKLLQPFTQDNTVGLTTCKIVYFDHPEIVWFGGGEINIKRGKQRTIDFRKPATAEGANKSRYVSFASGCAMMLKRSVLEEIGGFDDRLFMYVEDLELCMQLQKKHYKIWYTAATYILHKVHGSTSKQDGNLPALHPKNPKLEFYVYHMTKNLLLTMHKHLNGMQWMVFLFNYSIILTYKNTLYVINHRPEALKAFFKALSDFRKERNNKLKIKTL